MLKGQFLSFLNTKKESSFTALVLRGLAMFYLLLLVLTFVSIYLEGGSLFLAADHIFFLIVSLIVIFQRGGALAISFSRYFILLLSYEGMRGIADNVTPYVEYNIPLIFDKIIGGGRIPTQIFQENLVSLVPYVDQFSVFMYTLHFLVPLFFGIFLWFKRKECYEPYFLAFTITSYLALATFILMPVAPPWLAAEKGMIDIKHIILESEHIPVYVSMPSIYHLFNANPVAAFPSLHFALPVLVAYFGIRAFSKKGAVLLAYPLLMGFSLIYLGEHYVFDLLGGILYAFMGIFFAKSILKMYHESEFFKLNKLI